jgi:tetratricopeptide (TPR) repeat protein
VSVLLERGRRAAGGQGAVVAIEGPPGIGKTRLGEEAAALARTERFTVLSACGNELEQEFGFGAVRQLFEPVLAGADERRHRALFDGAARLASPALGVESATPALEGQDARFPVVHGLYWLTANLAGEAAVLLWVDDLQWVDRPTQRFLAYLSRRLTDLPVLLVVGLRPALPGEDRAEAGAIAAARETLLITPGPLSVEAVAVLAEERVGSPPDPAFAEECRRLTGGNALLVEELLTELEETGGGVAAGAARELGVTGVERIGRGVRRRLESLPGAASEIAQAVTVLGDSASLEAAAELAGLSGEDAARGAEALIAADVLTGETTLRFRHPLVRAAVADERSAVASAAAHGRAARILAGREAPVAAVATHLLASSPAADPWAVRVLREAARDVMRQGAPELAARHLQRAVEEPPPDADRAELLLDLGTAEEDAGLPAAADHMREAIALMEEPADRAGAALRLATALSARLRWREAAEVARGALADLAGADRELGFSLQAILADCVRMDPAGGDDEPERVRRLAATLSGDTRAERLVLATAASVTPADTAAALPQRAPGSRSARTSGNGNRLQLHSGGTARAGGARRRAGD